MSERLAYIATENTITIVLDGQNRTIQVRSKSHRNDVILALEKFKKSGQTARDKENLESFLAPIKRAVMASDNRFELDSDGKRLYLAGTQVSIPSELGDKIIDFLEHNLPVDPLVKFWESCLKNPHYIAVEELFVFLTENHLPITDDGGFLGYKKLNFIKGKNRIDVPDDFGELAVNSDGVVKSVRGGLVPPRLAEKFLEFINTVNAPVLVDVWTGKIQQKVGEVVRIERLKLGEAERREECGYGLHVGAFGYSFSGDVRVLCKVMPEDVIACNKGQAKLRTCKYQIVSFVDSAKEVKELLVNLTNEEAKIASGNCQEDFNSETDFDAGDTLRCTLTRSDYEVTEDRYYYVVDADGGEVLIVDDNGDQSWVDASLFELKD